MMKDKNAGNAAPAALLFFTAVIFVLFPSETASAVRTAVGNCLDVIVPSLFALMVLSEIYTGSGLYRRTDRLSRFAAKYILKIPPEATPVFIVSMVSGYPVGAALITAAVKDGAIDRGEGERLLCVCFGAGPAFIYGAVGAGVFGQTGAGTPIFLSCLAANIIICLLTARGGNLSEKSEAPAPVDFSPELLCGSVCGGGKNILKMCGIIIFMSAVLSVPDTLGITSALSGLLGNALRTDPYYVYTALRSAAEISNIAYLKTDSLETLPMAAALISFGGISVFMQIASVCGGTLRIGKMIISRFFAAALSGVLCGILSDIFCGDTVVQTMAQVKEVRHNSPIPALFLLIMTILLLSEKNVVKIKKM